MHVAELKAPNDCAVNLVQVGVGVGDGAGIKGPPGLNVKGVSVAEAESSIMAGIRMFLTGPSGTAMIHVPVRLHCVTVVVVIEGRDVTSTHTGPGPNKSVCSAQLPQSVYEVAVAVAAYWVQPANGLPSMLSVQFGVGDGAGMSGPPGSMDVRGVSLLLLVDEAGTNDPPGLIEVRATSV